MFTYEELRKLTYWMMPQVYGDPIDLDTFTQLKEAIRSHDVDRIHLLLVKELPKDTDDNMFLW